MHTLHTNYVSSSLVACLAASWALLSLVVVERERGWSSLLVPQRKRERERERWGMMSLREFSCREKEILSIAGGGGGEKHFQGTAWCCLLYSHTGEYYGGNRRGSGSNLSAVSFGLSQEMEKENCPCFVGLTFFCLRCMLHCTFMEHIRMPSSFHFRMTSHCDPIRFVPTKLMDFFSLKSSLLPPERWKSRFVSINYDLLPFQKGGKS